MFLEIQFQAANASHHITPHKKAILQSLCKKLGFAPAFSWEYANIFGENNNQRHYQHKVKTPSIDDAYRILAVKKTNSDAEIKKAYRRLMSQNHPDKLISKGLPESMLKMANSKTQKIKEAYDRIKKSRQ